MTASQGIRRLVNLDALKAEIYDSLTIGQVAEALGAELQASGDQWRCLCLLHTENTPSMYFSDAKRVYKCWGCDAGGDMINLVECVRHLDFIETLYWLAAEADVPIEKYERPLTEDERRRKEFARWCERWLTA